MAGARNKAGEWWIIFAALLLGGAGLVAVVLADHGSRVARLREAGLVTAATITGKHEETQVVDRRKRDTTYQATFLDVSYDPSPSTPWADFIANGEQLAEGAVDDGGMSAAINTGSREIFDSYDVGEPVFVVVDPDDMANPALAEFVHDFNTNGQLAGAILAALAGLGCIFMYWRARRRAC